MSDRWTVRFNPATGEPIYFDDNGNVTAIKPEGFEAPPPPVARSGIASLLPQKQTFDMKSKYSKKSKAKKDKTRASGKSKKKKGKRGLDDLTTDLDFELGVDRVTKGTKNPKYGSRGSKDKKNKKSRAKSKQKRKTDETDVSIYGKDESTNVFETKAAQFTQSGEPPVYKAEEEAMIYNFENNFPAYNFKNAPNVEVFKWTNYAHNLGYLTALLFVVMGPISFLWEIVLQGNLVDLPDDVDTFIVAPPNLGFVVFGSGILMFIYERFWGLNRSFSCDASGVLGYSRALLYVVLGVPALFSYATVWAGAISFIAATANVLATRNREVGRPLQAFDKKTGKWYYKTKVNYCFNYFDWNETRGTFTLAILFIFANILVFTYLFSKQQFLIIVCFDDFADDADLVCPTFVASIAKGFGNALNLDCSILIIPIMRTLLTTVAERFNRSNAVPITKGVEFHQIIGSVVGLAVAGHTYAHYINYAFAAKQTIQAFGKQPWFTGAAIILVMAVLYSGAHAVAKRANYEVFWFTHHTYTLFFMLLLAHGPHFWEWFWIPVLAFTYEKSVRHRDRLKRKIYVRSVEYTKPVININFAPERVEDFDFVEGQYLYVFCPQASQYQWHPFTISSCTGDLERFNYVSVHIRVQDNVNSWTHILKEYFRRVCGAGNQGPDEPFFYDNFHHYNTKGQRVPGLFNGPDGLPLIRIDGPYTAPNQIYNTYRDAIVVGSGIGITPGAAIMRSVLRYKWAKGYYPDSLRFVWVLRQSEALSFLWLIELLVDLFAQLNADRRAGAIGANHFVQANIFITNAKPIEENKGGFKGPVRMTMGVNPNVSFIGRKVLENRSNSKKLMRRLLDDQLDVNIANKEGVEQGKEFTAQDLFDLIQKPTIMSSAQADIDPAAQGHVKRDNTLGEIYVWNGRPQWQHIFQQTINAARARNQQIAAQKGGDPEAAAELGVSTDKIGVMFCGAGPIGHALRVNGQKYSAKDIEFHLNEEFF